MLVPSASNCLFIVYPPRRWACGGKGRVISAPKYRKCFQVSVQFKLCILYKTFNKLHYKRKVACLSPINFFMLPQIGI
jgi:hypothetical protein